MRDMHQNNWYEIKLKNKIDNEGHNSKERNNM